MRLLCFFGLHRRSRSQVRHDGEDYVSRCSRCDAKMRKDQDGQWRLLDARAEG